MSRGNIKRIFVYFTIVLMIAVVFISVYFVQNISHSSFQIRPSMRALHLNIKTKLLQGIHNTNVTMVGIDGNTILSGVTKRQDSCRNCFPHGFKYVIDNEAICKLTSRVQRIDVVIFFPTTHDNMEARTTFRNTWLLQSRNNTSNVRYVFMLGETGNQTLREAVINENEVYHDIVKEDFVDSYRNLTYKTIMGFKWAATKCAHARYVMKSDTDVFVNITELLASLSTYSKILQNGVGGLHVKSPVYPDRRSNSKWQVTYDEYPNEFYPEYISGVSYLTSMNSCQNIYTVSANVPFLYIEDVYIGLCVKALNYTLVNVPGINYPKSKVCRCEGEPFITLHQVSPDEITTIWNDKCLNCTEANPDMNNWKIN